MAIPVDKVLEKLPPERREKIKTEGRRLIAEYDALQELRTALGVTQNELADILDVAQANVSRFEARDEHKLSALASYINALGGSLRLTVNFGDQEVDLTALIHQEQTQA